MPINRKLTLIILLTSAAVLLLAGAGMVATELVTTRRAMVQDLTALADVLGRNSTATLSFHREEDQDEIDKMLSALAADKQIMSAALYDKDNHVFGQYVRHTSMPPPPASPPANGKRFTAEYLEVALPVEMDQK